jgi:ubiquinone/menaquinone biosynthesis C-methylase UbiE
MAYTQSSRYRRCQSIFDRAYPDFRNAGDQYHDSVATVTDSTTHLLDIGCGRMSLAEEAVKVANYTVGIDLMHTDLLENRTLHAKAMANAATLPFPDASFDVLISQWVVEHFDSPTIAFREMNRVLRPGGHLVFLTTNANNYIPLFSRLVPDSAQKFLIHRILRRPTHESFPTFFRANTRRAIQRIAQDTDYIIDTIDYIGNPFYMAFNVPLFRLALLFEKITDRKSLNSLKLYLLATLRKEN